MDHEKGGQSVPLWFPLRLWTLVRQAAGRQTRSLAGQVRHYVIEGLRRDGLLDEGEVA